MTARDDLPHATRARLHRDRAEREDNPALALVQAVLSVSHELARANDTASESVPVRDETTKPAGEDIEAHRDGTRPRRRYPMTATEMERCARITTRLRNASSDYEVEYRSFTDEWVVTCNRGTLALFEFAADDLRWLLDQVRDHRSDAAMVRAEKRAVEAERDALGAAAFEAYKASGGDTDGAQTWQEFFRSVTHPAWPDLVRESVSEAIQTECEGVARLEAENARLRAAVEAVRVVHAQCPAPEACGVCHECVQDYPCRTIRALTTHLPDDKENTNEHH